MTRRACGGRAPTVMRVLWPLVVLASVSCVMSCAITGYEVEVDDTVSVASSAEDVTETPAATSPAPQSSSDSPAAACRSR